MSLHTLANHMSAHGRGPDSTLVHMSPREIQGLQSLAQAHGRYLTVNPQTGLPEAGILEDILPSIAGFAMDAFAPGSGTIASGIASLMGGESSSEPARSNPMGLASTSLERGLQAGFGTDIYEPSSKQMSEKESPAGSFGAIQSAINTAPPKDYLQENKYNMYSEPQRYDSGGMTIGNVGAPVDASGNPIVIDPYDTRTDSQKAQDYLLGKPGAVNPFLFYHGAIPKEAPAALTTAEVSSLMPESIGPTGTRGGLSFEAQQIKDDQDAWLNLSADEQAEKMIASPNMLGFHEGLLNIWSGTPLGMIQNAFDPGRQAKERAMIAKARGAIHARSFKQPPEYSPIPTQTPEQAQFNKDNFGIPLNQPPGAIFDINDFGENNDGSPSGNRGDGGGGYSGAPAAGSDVGRSAPGSAHAGQGGTSPGGEGGHPDGNSPGRDNAQGGLLDSRYAYGGGIAALAQGGMYNLGSYSDGGRLLRGPGDGVSDDIPATIGQNQPARLADGEFVFPARIVSELGNGSTEAGARKLYAMMDRVQKARSKTVGKNKVAVNSRADKYLSI